MLGGGATTNERKRTRERTRRTQKQGEVSDISCPKSLHYNNVQGPILLMHNEMMPIMNSKQSRCPGGLLNCEQRQLSLDRTRTKNKVTFFKKFTLRGQKVHNILVICLQSARTQIERKRGQKHKRSKGPASPVWFTIKEIDSPLRVFQCFCVPPHSLSLSLLLLHCHPNTNPVQM